MAWKKVTLSGDIVNADINASAAIAYSKLALTDSIKSADYSDASILSAHIGNDQITNALMADNAVAGDVIADEQIAAGKLADDSVITANIQDNAITLAKMAGGTDGNIISFDASGNPVAVATGTDGQVLTSTGAGSPPAFETAGSAATRGTLGLDTDDSPQFLALNIGAAADTTVAREGAGDLTVEGNHIYRVGGTDVSVADGGTGASSLTDGGVLFGSGTGAITAMAVLANSEMIVGDGTTDPVAESGATLRTSIGCDAAGTDNSTAVTLANTNYLSISGQAITGGTVPVGSGGTGATTLTDGGVLLGSGTGAVTAMGVLANSEMIVGDGTTDPVAESGSTLRTSIGCDVAGTDNSTNVTLANTNYLTISGQAITGGTVPAGSGGTGVTSMTALKDLLDGETWTFAEKVTMAGDLDVQGTTTTINSANTSFTDTSIQLNVADGESAFGNSASAIVFGDSTGATSTGRIINGGTAAAGFKFMTGNATNTPSGNNNVSDGGTYADCRMNGLVLKTQSEPTEVEGMVYWDGSNLYVGNPS